MRKFLALVLSICMLLTLVACKANEKREDYKFTIIGTWEGIYTKNAADLYADEENAELLEYVGEGDSFSIKFRMTFNEDGSVEYFATEEDVEAFIREVYDYKIDLYCRYVLDKTGIAYSDTKKDLEESLPFIEYYETFFTDTYDEFNYKANYTIDDNNITITYDSDVISHNYVVEDTTTMTVYNLFDMGEDYGITFIYYCD